MNTLLVQQPRLKLSRTRDSAPASIKELFQNDANAKIGHAQGQESGQIQFNSALAAPTREKPTGKQRSEDAQGKQGKGGFMSQMLGKQIFYERESRQYCQRKSGETGCRNAEK